MAATHTRTPVSSANIPFQTRLKLHSSPLFSRSPSFIVKCSNPLHINGFTDTKLAKNGGTMKDVPSDIDELDKAIKRVELAKKKLAEIEKHETEIRKMTEYINQIETRVSEIAEVEKRLTEARAMMVEAEHNVETERKTVNKNREKLESVKAAIVSTIVGTLASLPVTLTHFTNSHEFTVSTAITVITCALYGATYRYTIRRDLDDFHLKTGTSAAFGIVKGIATLDGQLSLDAISGAVCVSENVLIFLFAAVGLDICYKIGIISPFPLETRTKM